MKKLVKYGLNILIMLLILGGTFYFLFKDQEIGEIFVHVGQANKAWLLAGCASMVLFVGGEAACYHYIFDKLSYSVRLGKCLLLSCIGFFYSAITPGASGGQPVQVYYMTYVGVDPLIGTLSAMVVCIFYKFVLLLLCVAVIIIRPVVFFGALPQVKWLFAIGVIGNFSFIVFLLFVIFKPSIIFTLTSKSILFLGRIRILKNPDKTLRKAIKSLRNYEKGAEFLKKHLNIVPRLLLYTIIQRVAYFSVAYFAYRSLGLEGTDFFTLLTLQVLLSLSVDVLPLPGAAGANESVFVILFKEIFTESLVLPGLLLFRGVSFYALTIVCAVFSLIAHFYLKHVKLNLSLNIGNPIKKIEQIRHGLVRSGKKVEDVEVEGVVNFGKFRKEKLDKKAKEELEKKKKAESLINAGSSGEITQRADGKSG